MSDLIARRVRLLGPGVPTFYGEPVEIVRGEGVWLWDAAGRRYLDCYNNVAHVGHCHPKVVEAIAAQAGVLNTHSRYLHRGILDYAERLMARFGHGLRQVIMVCTGSEANDIALRMAEAATGRTGIIATDNTYHGNTAAVARLSTRRPPIGGYPGNVRLVPAPDGPDGADWGGLCRPCRAGDRRAGGGGARVCRADALSGLCQRGVAGGGAGVSRCHGRAGAPCRRADPV